MDDPTNILKALVIAPVTTLLLVLIWRLPSIIKAWDEARNNAQDRAMDLQRQKAAIDLKADESAAEGRHQEKVFDSEQVRAMQANFSADLAKMQREMKVLVARHVECETRAAALAVRVDQLEARVAELLSGEK